MSTGQSLGGAAESGCKGEDSAMTQIRKLA